MQIVDRKNSRNSVRFFTQFSNFIKSIVYLFSRYYDNPSEDASLSKEDEELLSIPKLSRMLTKEVALPEIEEVKQEILP